MLYDKRTLSFRSISTAEEKGIITVLAKVFAFGGFTYDGDGLDSLLYLRDASYLLYFLSYIHTFTKHCLQSEFISIWNMVVTFLAVGGSTVT